MKPAHQQQHETNQKRPTGPKETSLSSFYDKEKRKQQEEEQKKTKIGQTTATTTAERSRCNDAKFLLFAVTIFGAKKNLRRPIRRQIL